MTKRLSNPKVRRVASVTATGVPLGRIEGPENKANLWKALFELFELLRARCNREDAYQAYFERNPVVFEVLGYDRYATFEKSSKHTLPFDLERKFKPEPDFLCANESTGILTVFELKTPFVGKLITARSSDGNRAKLRENVNRHVVQAREYVASIKGSTEARQVVRDTLKLGRISDYEVTIVCGFAEDNDAQQVTDALAGSVPTVRVLYFDELLNLLAAEYERRRHGVESRAGWSQLLHLRLPEVHHNRRTYISDGGAKEKDRISLLREGNEILFECLDSRGRLHLLSGSISPGPHYIVFEFSTDEQGVYLSLQIDDEQKGLTLGQTQFHCDPDLSNYVVGADLDGGSGAEFDVFELVFVDHTLSLDQKLGVYGHILEDRRSAITHIHFNEECFMRSIPEGALVQSVEAFKPLVLPDGLRIGRINSKIPANAPKPRVSEAAVPVHRGGT